MTRLLVTVFVLLTVTAHAQTASEEAATAAFLKGLSQASASQYDAAVASFEQAWLLGHDPGALFRIAKVEEARGDCARGSAAFKRFLTTCAACPDRMAGTAAAAAMKRRCAISVQLDTTPSGAQVWLDGRALGVTPLSLTPTAGTHQLKVTLDAHAPRDEAITLRAGEQRTVTWTLAPLAAPPSLAAGPRYRPHAWASVGLAAVGLAAGVVYHGKYTDADDEITGHLGDGTPINTLQDDRDTYKTYRTVGLVTGGLGLTAAALFFGLDAIGGDTAVPQASVSADSYGLSWRF